MPVFILSEITKKGQRVQASVTANAHAPPPPRFHYTTTFRHNVTAPIGTAYMFTLSFKLTECCEAWIIRKQRTTQSKCIDLQVQYKEAERAKDTLMS